MEQLEMELPIFRLGDRLILFEGSICQITGTVIDFRPVWCADGLYPVIMTDQGFPMLVSYEWKPRKLEDNQQLTLSLF